MALKAANTSLALVVQVQTPDGEVHFVTVPVSLEQLSAVYNGLE